VSIRILHVEVGGSFGGSLKALETYLACSDHTQFEHEVLLYYPTPRAERLRPFVGNLRVRFPRTTPFTTSLDAKGTHSSWKLRLKNSWVMPHLLHGLDWAKTARNLSRTRRLALDFRKGDYNLIHVNNTFTYNVESLIAAEWADVPAVGHARNPIRANFFSKWALKKMRGVATVNQRLEHQLQAWDPLLPIQTCFDGVVLFPPDLDSVATLRNSLLPCGGILIGSAGRLDTQKGYIHLVHAARRVVDARPQVQFVIAGEGPLRLQLERLVVDLRLGNHFHLLGFRQDIQNCLMAMDLFISSSLWEGLPLVAVESILLGKPVVLTDVGGSPEVVIPGKSGYVVPAAEPEALAQAILAALDNLQVLRQGTEEVRRTLVARMEPRTSSQALDEFFKRVTRSAVSVR